MSREQLNALIEERARAFHEMKALVDDTGGKFAGEDEEKYAKLTAAMDDLDARIERYQDIIARESREREAREGMDALIRPVEDPQPREDDFLRAWAKAEAGTPKAIEVSLRGLQVEDAVRNGLPTKSVRSVRADLTSGSAAAGGNTVPTSFVRQLYEHLIENSAIRQTNATVYTTASGERLLIPKTTAHTAAATIVGEAALINEADPTFGQATLDSYKYAKLVQVSSELLQDTAVDLVGYLARSFGQAIANGQGAHFVTGTGSSQPNGVITAGSLAVTGGTGVSGVPTADNLIDLFYAVKEPYARNGYWLMRRATLGAVRKLTDSNGQYIWQPGLASAEPNTILDRPYVTDPNVPATATGATSVAFGDFSAYVIRDVAGLRFERSDEYAFGNDLVTYRVIMRSDGELVDQTGAIGTYKGGAS